MPRETTPPPPHILLVEPVWLRQPDEPNLWFDRFQRFLLAGPSRSLLGAYNAERIRAEKAQRPATSTPRSWDVAAIDWRWRERADAWDESERAQLWCEYAEARKRNREARLAILKAFQGKLVSALRLIEPGDARWPDVIAGIRLLNEQYRAEFDDLPTQRTEVTSTGVAVYLPQKDTLPDDTDEGR